MYKTYIQWSPLISNDKDADVGSEISLSNLSVIKFVMRMTTKTPNKISLCFCGMDWIGLHNAEVEKGVKSSQL